MDLILQQRIIFQLLLAFFLGILLGIERTYMHKGAGSRTFALVTVGATLFTAISKFGFSADDIDPSRVASQIVAGIGFLGMGVIIHRGSKVEGLTTAAGLWLAAAMGMAIAVELYYVAVATVFLAFLVFWGMRVVNFEDLVERWFDNEIQDKDESS